MSRFLLIAAVAATAGGLTAAPVAAKEDVEATLISPVPLDAAPGDEITVAWTLVFVDDEGKRQPFGASGVYIRLLGAAGGEPTIGASSGSAHDDGRYEATVLVPEGGIGGVQIGLRGISSDTEGTYPSDVFFPITNNPLPAVTDTTPAAGASDSARAAPEPLAERSSIVFGLWIAFALAFVAALPAVVVLVRRRRPPAASS
jgi:hypothetical protein